MNRKCKKSFVVVSLLALFFLFSTMSMAQPSLLSELQQIVRAARYPLSSVAFAMGEVRADTLLVAMNVDSMMVPASVLKLITGAAAFEIFGPNRSFATTIFHDGFFDRKLGTLSGNLYIRGSGDPGMLTERLWLLAQQLYHRGVRVIEKDLVLDASFFDTIGVGPGFAAESSGRAYEASVSALASTFNCICVHVRPGSVVGDPVVAELFPPLAGATLSVTATTIEAGKRGLCEIRTERIKEGRIRVVVAGSMPLDGKPQYIYRKTPDPVIIFGEALKAFLAERSVSIQGKVRCGVTPDSIVKADTLLTFASRPLPEHIGAMFKYSSNFAAEMIFKSLGAAAEGKGSWEGGERQILQWWQKSGLPLTPVIKNGSGMGTINRMSTRQVVALLRYVWGRREYLPEYLAALSIAGVDGTLQSRFQKSPLRGVVRAKTGTLNDSGVSTIAGYVLMPEKTFAFAIFINNPRGSQITSWTLQEKLLETAVVHSLRPSQDMQHDADRSPGID